MSGLRYDRVIEAWDKHLNVEWLYGRQIVAIRPASNTPPWEIVETWAQAMTTLSQRWSPEQPYLCLLDATYIPYTTYTAHRLREVVAAIPNHLIGRQVMVIPGYNPFFRLYATRLIRQQLPMIEAQSFVTYEGALTWLVEELRWGKTWSKFTLKPSA